MIDKLLSGKSKREVKHIKKSLQELQQFNFKELQYIITELKDLKENGTYEKIFNTVNQGRNIIEQGADLTLDEQKNRCLKPLAKNILNNPIIKFHSPPFSDIILYSDFRAMYTFLEIIYFINIGKKLDHTDAVHLYLSRLDERIIFNLDKFDKTLNIPKPTEQFFKRLKKLRWKDKSTKKLFKKLSDLRTYAAYGIFKGVQFINLLATEDDFILFLAGCSSVNNDREFIDENDVICAYKTYFKLLKTDITKFKAKTEFADSNGYLVCEDCNEYYQLQPSESPKEFTDECECGGKLIFVKNLNDL